MKPVDVIGSQPGRVLRVVCLLGQLVHGPLRGQAFREQRA